MQTPCIVAIFLQIAWVVDGSVLDNRNRQAILALDSSRHRQSLRSRPGVNTQCAPANVSDAVLVASLADGRPCNSMRTGTCGAVLADASIGEHGLCNTAELTKAFHDGSCLVYGVGIADNWDFEKAMARHGCEVHAFDPTIEKPPKEEPSLANLHFHRWGLAGKTERSGTHQVRGTLSGAKVTDEPMLTLADMMEELGHTGRQLTVLKVDCEGCEWASLSVVSPELWSRIGQMSLELHFSDGLMLDSPEQVHNAAIVAKALQDAGFTKWRPDIREGWPWHRNLRPELLEAGMPKGMCCRLAGFYRKGSI